MKHGWAIAVLLMCAGCAQAGGETGSAIIHGTAKDSTMSGTATLTETPRGLRVVVKLANLPPGDHGLHIHDTGSCAEAGKAAGGHYNPDGVKHGFLPKDGFSGAHAGDLGNITIAHDGTGTLAVTIPDLHLTKGARTVAGRAVIVHEQVDDFGQPTGNAGGRIACGVIEVAKN